VRMHGWTIAEIPVNHRPRAGGKSKYGIHNRLWSGLRDIFGVRWLQSRARTWKVVDPAEQEES
jgi:dolichol-phosphate mannosyltransferase